MTKEEMMQSGRDLYLYELSEQADQENNDFDALWQSIYDVCQLATYGILGDFEQEDIDEALQWLKTCQNQTVKYKDTEIYF